MCDYYIKLIMSFFLLAFKRMHRMTMSSTILKRSKFYTNSWKKFCLVLRVEAIW